MTTYTNITGISRAVMKDNSQVTLANYDGNARPGELVVNLETNPPALYVGNNAGALTLVASGGGGLPLANGDSNFNIPDASGNVLIEVNDSYIWTFDVNGNLNIPSNIVGAGTIRIDNTATGNTADIQLWAADDIVLQGRDRDENSSSSEGGDINLFAGDGRPGIGDDASSGGDIQLIGGDGGDAGDSDSGSTGGFITIRSGNGGQASATDNRTAGGGGDLSLTAGDAGFADGVDSLGSSGGDVIITAGDSTGNGISGGAIILSTGSGGQNGAGGIVQIDIPSSDRGAGGTWIFGHNGNLTLPNSGNINGADGESVRLQSVSEGVVQSSVILNPNDGLTRLESWDNENFESYTSSDWSSATYVADEGGGYIAFVDAPNILNLANSIETSRLTLQVNGGAFLPQNGFNTSGNNITFFVTTAPVDSPETVIDFTMAWVPRSRIEMDYDEGELNIQAQDLDITITSNQEIDIQSSDRIRLENSSTVNGITIATDTANTFQTWTFDVAGNLILPRGGAVYETNIPYGGFSGNTIALAPSGGTNADQQLLVYPTVGTDANHLHLTSGNLYNTELFLGNDDLYVKLANTGAVVINTNDNAGNTAQWTFGTTGTILNSGNLTLQTPSGIPSSVVAITNSSGSWESNPTSNLATTGGSGTGLRVNVSDVESGYAGVIAIATPGTGYSDGDSISVVSGSSNATFTISVLANGWTFGTNGVLTLPGEGVLQSIDDTVTLTSLDTETGNANSVYLGSSGGVGFYDQAIGGNWLEIFRSGAEPEIRVPVGRGNLNIQTAQGENSYNWKFDDTGILSLPTIGGDEGGEINFGIPTANTTLTTRVVLDVFQDRIRFFDGSTKGAYIDLAQASTGVSTLLNNRVSGLVNAGTFVTMDNLRATITTSSNRGLSLATVAGTITYDIGGTYGASVATGGASLNAQTLTTSATTSIFGWNFPAQGDTATYILNDTTNSRAYRITIMIGLSYNSNMISIERLV